VLGLPASLDDRRSIHVLDALAVLWTLLWVVIGYLVYHEVSALTSLSNTVVTAGRALDETAATLSAVSDIPLIGGRIGDLAAQAHRTAVSAVANGRESRGDIRNLAVLLGIAVAAAPTTPLLVLYGLLRNGWWRDVHAARELAEGLEDDVVLERLLARRALDRLPYRQLKRVSANPWLDYEEGRTRDLARAELERMGLRRNGT
jgi:hypothetical protein